MSIRDRHTTAYVSAPARTGKSFSRTQWIVDRFLPLERGIVITNLPLKVDAIVDHVGKGKTKEDIELLRSRIELIDHETWMSWQNDVKDGGTGIWDYLANRDISGAHIIIDEAHYVAGFHHSTEHIRHWMTFCGGLGHRKASIEFMSQFDEKVAKRVRDEAGGKTQLINMEKKKLPIFGTSYSDLYELKAAFTGSYVSSVWEMEKRKVFGKDVIEGVKKFRLWPDYFRFYSSNNQLEETETADDSAPEFEFQKRSKIGMLVWFARRNIKLVMALIVFPFVVLYGISGRAGKDIGLRMHRFVNDVVQKNLDPSDEPVPPPGELSSGIVVEKRIITRLELREELNRVNEEYKESSGELATMRASQAAMSQSLEKYRQRFAPESALGMLTAESIMFRDGIEVKIGELVPFGTFKGRQLKEINYERKFAVIGDESVRFINVRGLSQSSDPRVGAKLPQTLQKFTAGGKKADH